MINIMIVDDMAEYIDYYSMIISKQPDMAVVGSATSAAEAIKKAPLYNPNVILMDIQMEHDTAGLEATAEIKKLLPETKILILTVHQQKELIVKAYEAGISEYLLKTASPEEIIDGIKGLYKNTSMLYNIYEVIKNEMVKLSQERKNFIQTLTALNRFSQTELLVINELIKNRTYPQIASHLNLQESTVRTLIRRIGTKLGNQPIHEFINTLKDLNATDLIDALLK